MRATILILATAFFQVCLATNIKARQSTPGTSSTASASSPSPTQAGVAPNCNRWDFVGPGTSCQTFINKYSGVTLALLYAWNPAIGASCTGLWADYYVCTGVGFSPTPSTSPPLATPSVPSPTQAGVAGNCNRWDLVTSGSSCQTFTGKYPGVTVALLYTWNPAIGPDCTGLWLDYYICTGIEGSTPTPVPSTTDSTPTSPSIPSPIQAGAVANCNRWDLVASGTTCQTFITKYPDVTLALLYTWNPAIGSACTGLWLDYYVCTGVGGFTAPTPSTASPTTTSVSAPGPTQAGQPLNCNNWELVDSGETCDTIAAKYSPLATTQLLSWNPAVGADCSSLWIGYYVCVGTTTYAPPTFLPTTLATTTISAGGPTQIGQPSSCRSWYQVVPGDSCEGIVAKFGGFSLATFYAWNPAVGTNCGGLWLGYFVCVGA